MILIVMLLLASSANAQSVPHEDREFGMDTVALGAAWTMDTLSTHQSFARCSSCIESGGLFDGSRSTAKIMGAWALVDLGAVIVSYEWKRHVRNRWLHPLWRVPLLVGTEEHARAASGNWLALAKEGTR